VYDGVFAGFLEWHRICKKILKAVVIKVGGIEKSASYNDALSYFKEALIKSNYF